MEENVALDSKKQKKFVKSIRGIKKLIKKNEKSQTKSGPKKQDEAKPEKSFSMRLKDGKIKKKKRPERGLVYLSHIPHGFYEHQMTQYFKQFGVVTNARVIKSKHTGHSKGYAFVEFKEPSVAQIVAETMNNYLMGKRLIKAAYIPPEKQRRAFRKNWNSVHNPSSVKRLKLKKAFNEDKDAAGDLAKAKKLLANLNKTKKKLKGLGINYDFFLPVDVPEALIDKVIKKEKDKEIKEENETKPKKGKKQNNEEKDDKKKVENVKQGKDKKLNKNEKEIKPTDIQNIKQGKNKINKNEKEIKLNDGQNLKQGKDKKATKNEKETKSNEVNKKEKQEITVKGNKKDQKPVKVNEKQQKEKENKLKDAGVKSLEEFISLDAEEDSDESCDFDSDEYENMLENEDDDLSSGEEEESGDDDDGDEESGDDSEGSEDEEDESDEEEVPTPKKPQVKGKPPPKVQPSGQGKKQTQKPQAKNLPAKIPHEVKRKAPQKPPVAAKKPKFEKQNQKPLKKQFKKK